MTTLGVEFKSPGRVVHWLHDHGLRWVLTKPFVLLSLFLSISGVLAFVHNYRSKLFGLTGKSLAIGFVVLLAIQYFGVFVHELGHALVLFHNGRRMKAIPLYRGRYPPSVKDEVMLRSWFRDQVLHPHETQHTVEEVLPWIKAAGLEPRTTSVNEFRPVTDWNESRCTVLIWNRPQLSPPLLTADGSRFDSHWATRMAWSLVWPNARVMAS